MAAKPPKPPGNFLKNFIHGTTNTNTNNNSNTNNSNSNNNNNNDTHIHNKETEITDFKANSLCAYAADTCNTNTIAKKSHCNCTNITIMHLFHEMKQEFPTIPDTIVQQCVNENCHQRENCIQMLRNELELNPIPVQSYPAKVLHPPNYNNTSNNSYNHHHNNNNNNTSSNNSALPPNASYSHQKPPLQQKPLVQQRKPPLKPVRPAPLHPPAPPPPTTAGISNNNTNSPILQKRIPNQQQSSTITRALSNEGLLSGDNGHTINETSNAMSTTTVPPQVQQLQQQHSTNSTHHGEELKTHNNNENFCSSGGETNANVGKLPRARPTTLNLNVQQQQRQRLNVQLQDHFQQPRKTTPANTQASNNNNNKPLRKAPLPPIAPKPLVFHHSNANANHYVSGVGDTSNVCSPQSESEISVNLTLSTPSPTSSTSSTSLTTTSTSKTHHHHNHHHHHPPQHLQNKSPIRHRSVITLQPEPPYTRDFFSSNTAPQTPPCITAAGTSSVVSSPTNSAHSGTSQKSYTSVNLTLRPPTTALNAGLQPSAIDITAGPGFSGASGGGKSLSYSSTSYDARLGYQQNFHITVTDEGGVFSASRRRPQQQQQRNLNQVNICKNEYDGNSGGDKGNNLNSLYAEQQQQQLQQQQQQQQQILQQQQTQFHNTDAVALRQTHSQHPQQQASNPSHTPPGIGGQQRDFGNMCLAPQQTEEDAFVTETLERQKKRRDRLAGALRENKKRLSQVEHEVNLITGPIPEGLSERLDIEIQQLRAECQAMLRSSNPLTQQQRPQPQPHPQQQQQHQQQQYLEQQQQFPPQPFPRQRAARPPPRPPPNALASTMPRQSSLDIIQHHNTPTTPHTPASLPNYLHTPSPTMNVPQQQLQHSPHTPTPSLYQQQQQQQLQQPPYGVPYHQQHPTPPSLYMANNAIPDDEPPSYYSDQDVGDYEDDEDDDEYEVVEHWECSMCTFRNHPQLNICECCDNVRILPGTLTNLSRALSSNTTASAVAGLTNVNANATASVTDVNAAGEAASAGGTINALNAAAASVSAAGSASNLDHDSTALAQQQLQHLALHT